MKPGEALPTPAEIAAACSAIQAAWTDDERIDREVYGRVPWRLPEPPIR